MNLVVLGLCLSSSWGNGHATTYRALLRAFAARGHTVTFLERDKPWYADHRDLADPDYCSLHLYGSVTDLERHHALIAGADAVMVGSYVPDGVAVANTVLATARGTVAFYDIDTPITLAKLAANEAEYLTLDLVPRFDVYLSFTGGPTLERLQRHYGAQQTRALYCSVDEAAYHPLGVPPSIDLGYIGTYSDDRQPALDRLLLEPARRRPDLSFVVAGPQYPAAIDWPRNVARIEHLPPSDHARFYASLRWTLNVTRADMIAAGHSPSVRLFEAAACATPIISDLWPGLTDLFKDGTDILTATTPEDVLRALSLPNAPRRSVGAAGQARVLAAHTAAHRAVELEHHLLYAAALRRAA